jgi:hypothetical protein
MININAHHILTAKMENASSRRGTFFSERKNHNSASVINVPNLKNVKWIASMVFVLVHLWELHVERNLVMLDSIATLPMLAILRRTLETIAILMKMILVVPSKSAIMTPGNVS